jgi:hypothetical protein
MLALQLFVVTFCNSSINDYGTELEVRALNGPEEPLKKNSSINPITNPNPVYSHSIT